MAIRRFSVHIGTKGRALAHFNYITASGKYENKKGVIYTDFGNMPKWAENDPAKFWEAADEYERANGQTYKEHIISIPREIHANARRYFVSSWLHKELGCSLPFAYAIHETQASDGKTNPHAHIMFSTRKLDGIDRSPEQFFKRYNPKDPSKGGAKKIDTGLSRAEMKKNLEEQRERWTFHVAEFARPFDYYIERPLDPDYFSNKSMVEVQKEQKLDAMLEQHRWYLSPEPIPKFVPPPPEPSPQPQPEPQPELPPQPELNPWGETKYARENAENAHIRSDEPTQPQPPTPTPKPEKTQNRGYEYDFGM